MPRTVYRFRLKPDGTWESFEVKDYEPEVRGYVIEDSMDAIVHPADGRVYDSKSEFRRVTRQHGCVEVGNETQSDRRTRDIPGLKEDLLRAWDKYH